MQSNFVLKLIFHSIKCVIIIQPPMNYKIQIIIMLFAQSDKWGVTECSKKFKSFILGRWHLEFISSSKISDRTNVFTRLNGRMCVLCEVRLSCSGREIPTSLNSYSYIYYWCINLRFLTLFILCSVFSFREILDYFFSGSSITFIISFICLSLRFFLISISLRWSERPRVSFLCFPFALLKLCKLHQ